MTTKEAALQYLYSQLKASKIALSKAEVRKGVTDEEIANLKTKIAALDWLIPLAIREEE